jgi:hypothetical protein
LRRVLVIVIWNLFGIWCLCPPWRDLFGSYCLPAGLLMLNNKQKAYVQTVWARNLEFLPLNNSCLIRVSFSIKPAVVLACGPPEAEHLKFFSIGGIDFERHDAF